MFRRRKISLRKALFVLPNMFTLGATFCAFTSMLVVSQAVRPYDYLAAGWLIGFAGILDGTDGRVARLTRTQSTFGMELDSLSDAIAFGVAPAWLVYHWGLQSLWPVGFLVAFWWVAATCIRLARFNVIAGDGGDPRFFVGLPTPAAAGIIGATVCVQTGTGEFGITASSQIFVAITVALIGLLMVSNIRFRSFKGVDLRRRRNQLILFAWAGSAAYISVTLRFEAGLLFGLVSYVAFHLAAAAVHLERRVRGKVLSWRGEELLFGIDEPDDDEDEETVVL